MSGCTLMIERDGKFSVRYTERNDNQCGNLKADILLYNVKICVADTALDENGFIIDNMVIYNYFRDTFHEVAVFQSCERIALQAMNYFRDMLKEHLVSIEVTVSGVPEAKMTARWNAPSDLATSKELWAATERVRQLTA